MKLSSFVLLGALLLASGRLAGAEDDAVPPPPLPKASAEEPAPVPTEDAEPVKPPAAEVDAGSWSHDATAPFGEKSEGSCDCSDGGCEGSCESSCGGCGECECCLPPPWTHRCTFFGDFLYMRARSSEVAYGVPIDGPIVPPPSNNPIQIGRVATVDPDYSANFRAGFGIALSPCSSIIATYTRFETDTQNGISTDAPNVIRSLVSHPSSQSASTDFLSATAGLGIDFDLVDADYRRVWLSSSRSALNYILGARYANLDQEFQAYFVDNGVENVNTNIGFDGGGIRVGLDAERFAQGCGLMVYGRGIASFVAGEYRARYLQQQSFDPVVVDTSWKSGRVVPILDLEIGAGWQSPGQRFRVSAGYMVSAWFNSVKTNDFIQAVQANDFTGLNNTLTFDGLVARAELRY